MIYRNIVSISGQIISNIEDVAEQSSSNKVIDKYGYKVIEIASVRQSGASDKVRILCSEEQVKALSNQYNTITRIKVSGELVSYNFTREDGKRGVYIAVKANRIIPYNEKEDVNHVLVYADLVSTKPPRSTKVGGSVMDVILTYTDNNEHTSYINAIVWNSLVPFFKGVDKEDHLYVKGRLQSRDYTKVLDNGVITQKTAYELSVVEAKKLLY
jgi:hypothetical protein